MLFCQLYCTYLCVFNEHSFKFHRQSNPAFVELVSFLELLKTDFKICNLRKQYNQKKATHATIKTKRKTVGKVYSYIYRVSQKVRKYSRALFWGQEKTLLHIFSLETVNESSKFYMLKTI